MYSLNPQKLQEDFLFNILLTIPPPQKKIFKGFLLVIKRKQIFVYQMKAEMQRRAQLLRQRILFEPTGSRIHIPHNNTQHVQ